MPHYFGIFLWENEDLEIHTFGNQQEEESQLRLKAEGGHELRL